MSKASRDDALVVGVLYRWLSMAGMAMALLGVALEFMLTGVIRGSLWAPTELIGALGRLEVSALTTLGVWLLVSGPWLGLVILGWRGLSSRRWMQGMLALLVLLVVALSIPLKLALKGA
ncbi:hypothetical protein DL240_16490 [Lujinxingia litoralis]|uniref:DUF1634 domain-containing protein n=1 Tax=Lujinxingia litoralis TaxID=2211119 RepID=A0A328C1X5_9DELT|nr:DUF1634 domain-containing protein [Lujinxingia litoralis]RAL20629.1 hypothetical protein DL240_16490 [Lujinxingia litoralis]